jgi:RNA polymerase sigma-70 factor (ECF subfamily)
MRTRDAHELFTRLLIECEPQLLRFVLVVIPHRSDARDILQECSVALWRRFSDYDPERPFVNWAMGFAKIEIRRFLRKTQRRTQLTSQAAELLLQDNQAHTANLDEREHHLKFCLETLSGDHRELLDSYYYNELSVGELSERDGRSKEAVYKMLQRIRHALHQCIETNMRGVEA